MTREIRIGDIVIGNDNPIVLIAGPCVIESRNMALDIAKSTQIICQKLKIPYIFKSSYDKANRSSIKSYRGPGLIRGIKILREIKRRFRLPICVDVHEISQIDEVKEVADIIQIPAFLCRQTDLILQAAKTQKVLNIKKGQFIAPWDVKNIIEKIVTTGNHQILLTERGFCFGYNNLVVDMKSIHIMRQTGYPVIFDGSHSVQQPGGKETYTGGEREMIPPLLRAAAAVGCDGIFLEVHPHPEKALSDGPNMVRLNQLESILKDVIDIDRLIKGRL